MAADQYGARAAEFAARYESVDPNVLNDDLIPFMTYAPCTVLDVGAGSGRDAAWFSSLGHDVCCVEPSDAMTRQAKRLHPRLRWWVKDSLPELGVLRSEGHRFEMVNVCAVWMHVAPADRRRAFESLLSVCEKDAALAFAFRDPPDSSMGMAPVGQEEILALASVTGCAIAYDRSTDDMLGRDKVSWTRQVVLAPS